ncbi:MAG: hypothetical protein GY864_12115 [Desulfobacterales bacterium]|nr:hypothetical protein [Desulfobacterales bacterium]
MGKILYLQTKPQEAPDNLITSKPWEFRKPYWETAHFVQMSRPHSNELECRVGDNYDELTINNRNVPSHIPLEGGCANTIRAMYASREDEESMRETYYLAGLIDCMINQVNPILRTDILRAMYKMVFATKKKLNIHWYGPLDQVLLPLGPRLYDMSKYRSSLNRAKTMKEIYQTIRKGTDNMFDILSVEYVFYCPMAGG